MKTSLLFPAAVVAFLLQSAGTLLAADQSIDWERAKALFDRSQSGEKLTEDEQKYLDEARRQRGARDEAMREKMRGIKEKMDRGEKLTDDEQRMVEEFRRRAGGGPEMERARQLFEKKQRGEKLTADEEKFLEEAGKRRMARDGGFDWERARQLNMKRESGEPLTDGEQKFLAEAMRRREAGEGPGGGRPPGAPGGGEFTWERAQAAHAREQRGDTLSDDEKKLLAEARKRFEEGRGPDKDSASREQPQRSQEPLPKSQGVAPQAKDDFDWEKAKAAHEKERRGEALSDSEKALLDAAKKRMSEGRGPGRPGGAPDARRAPVAPPPKDLVPLTELTAKYKDQDGGLYGGGSDEPPGEHVALVINALVEIRPLDRDGKLSTDGKIALMSIGMSNTTQEFSAFVRMANADARKAPQVVVVDAAQGGKDADSWAAADAQPWTFAEQRLQNAGVSPAQQGSRI